jgi:hypothetical protein
MRRLIRIKPRQQKISPAPSTTGLEQLFSHGANDLPRAVTAIRRDKPITAVVTYVRVEHNKFKNCPQVTLKGADDGAGWNWYSVYEPSGKLSHNVGTYSGPYIVDFSFIKEMIDRFYEKPVNELSAEDF